MKKKIYKWILIGIGAILLILIVTNPSSNRYDEYLKANGFKLEGITNDYTQEDTHPYWGRASNYFIFSTFKYNDGSYGYIPDRHVGILGNFYELN